MLTWSEAPRAKGQSDEVENWDGKLGALCCAFLSKQPWHRITNDGPDEFWQVMVWLHWKEVKTMVFFDRDKAMAAADAEIARELELMGLQVKPVDG